MICERVCSARRGALPPLCLFVLWPRGLWVWFATQSALWCEGRGGASGVPALMRIGNAWKVLGPRSRIKGAARTGLEYAPPGQPAEPHAGAQGAGHPGREHAVPVLWHVAQHLRLVRLLSAARPCGGALCSARPGAALCAALGAPPR